MKKNGFTLVEVLAVIIVMGLLATITGPYVIRSINTSKKNAFKNSVEGIVRVIENEYTITNGTIKDQSGNKLKKAGGDGEIGSAYLDENGRIAIAVENNNKKWCAQKRLKQSGITITENNGNCNLIK